MMSLKDPRIRKRKYESMDMVSEYDMEDILHGKLLCREDCPELNIVKKSQENEQECATVEQRLTRAKHHNSSLNVTKNMEMQVLQHLKQQALDLEKEYQATNNELKTKKHCEDFRLNIETSSLVSLERNFIKVEKEKKKSYMLLLETEEENSNLKETISTQQEEIKNIKSKIEEIKNGMEKRKRDLNDIIEQKKQKIINVVSSIETLQRKMDEEKKKHKNNLKKLAEMRKQNSNLREKRRLLKNETEKLQNSATELQRECAEEDLQSKERTDNNDQETETSILNKLKEQSKELDTRNENVLKELKEAESKNTILKNENYMVRMKNWSLHRKVNKMKRHVHEQVCDFEIQQLTEVKVRCIVSFNYGIVQREIILQDTISMEHLTNNKKLLKELINKRESDMHILSSKDGKINGLVHEIIDDTNMTEADMREKENKIRQSCIVHCSEMQNSSDETQNVPPVIDKESDDESDCQIVAEYTEEADEGDESEGIKSDDADIITISDSEDEEETETEIAAGGKQAND